MPGDYLTIEVNGGEADQAGRRSAGSMT